MTNTEAHDEMVLARAVALAAAEVWKDRIAVLDHRDWVADVDGAGFRAYSAAFESVQIAVSGPRCVVASVQVGARSFGYLASDALDVDIVDIAVGSSLPASVVPYSVADAIIEEIGLGVWTLSW